MFITSIFIATSLDGYISRPDGSIDWLTQANTLIHDSEDCGHHAFMETVDVLIMGRHTYEQVLSFHPWPYPNHTTIVLSTGNPPIPEPLSNNVQISNLPPRQLLERLAARGHSHAYIDGGRCIQSFLAEGLIDRLTITTIPVLLGAGRPLFGPLPQDVRLELESSKAYDFGFVQSTYRVVKA